MACLSTVWQPTPVFSAAALRRCKPVGFLGVGLKFHDVSRFAGHTCSSLVNTATRYRPDAVLPNSLHRLCGRRPRPRATPWSRSCTHCQFLRWTAHPFDGSCGDDHVFAARSSCFRTEWPISPRLHSRTRRARMRVPFGCSPHAGDGPHFLAFFSPPGAS